MKTVMSPARERAPLSPELAELERLTAKDFNDHLLDAAAVFESVCKARYHGCLLEALGHLLVEKGIVSPRELEATVALYVGHAVADLAETLEPLTAGGEEMSCT